MLNQVDENADYIKYFKEINELLDEFLNVTEDDLKHFNYFKKADDIPHSQEMIGDSSKINNLLISFDNFYQKIKFQNPNNYLLVLQFVYVLISIRPKLCDFYKEQFKSYQFSPFFALSHQNNDQNKDDFFMFRFKKDLDFSYSHIFHHYFCIDNEEDIIIDCLMNDDVEILKDYLIRTDNSVHDFCIKNDFISYLGGILDQYPENLLDLSAFYGSLLIFKYCIMNECIPTIETCKYAIAGGNYEIIHILEQHALSFDDCRNISIAFHRYELTEWLDTHYEHSPFNSYIALLYLNFKALVYYEYEENLHLPSYYKIYRNSISLGLYYNFTDFLIYEINKISNNIRRQRIMNEILPITINYNAINFIVYLLENKFIEPNQTIIKRKTSLLIPFESFYTPMVESQIQTLMDCAISSNSEEIVIYLFNQPNLNDESKNAAREWLIKSGKIIKYPDLNC